MNREVKKSFRAWLSVLLLAMLVLGSLGCATEGIARDLNYTHWHDEETIILVYHRDLNAGGISSLWRPSPTTTHVLVCQIRPENNVVCKDQRQVANLLNPHAVDYVDLADTWRP